MCSFCTAGVGSDHRWPSPQVLHLLMNVRIKIVFVLIVVIFLGLMSRKFIGLFPESIGQYPGDAFWAVAVYLSWGLILPAAKELRLMLLALATSYLVEFSQLYHAPWLDEIRDQTWGHLLLASTFNATDLVAYAVGVFTFYIVESGLNKHGWFRSGKTE